MSGPRCYRDARGTLWREARCSMCGERKLVFHTRWELAKDWPLMCADCYGLYARARKLARSLPPTQADWQLLATVFRDLEWEAEFLARIDEQAAIADP